MAQAEVLFHLVQTGCISVFTHWKCDDKNFIFVSVFYHNCTLTFSVKKIIIITIGSKTLMGTVAEKIKLQ